jgi:SNF2 family DNA or RNA helicase
MEELWPQLYLLDKGERLGRTLTAYREQHFHPVQFNRKNPNEVWKYGVKPGHDTQILAKLGDIALAMRKEDWLTLPPLIRKMVPVDIGKAAMEMYRELEKEAVLEYVGGAISAVNAAVLVGKLAQAANGAVYEDGGDAVVLHHAKLDALSDLVDELAGERVLVFYGYKHDLARLKMRFPYAVAMADDKRAVERWNRREIRMMLAHPKSAGHGLNLQEGGNHMVWFSLPWSLELYQQANARLHRSGQKNTVVLHHLIARDTVDEQIVARLDGKQQTLDQVMDAVRMRVLPSEQLAA